MTQLDAKADFEQTLRRLLELDEGVAKHQLQSLATYAQEARPSTGESSSDCSEVRRDIWSQTSPQRRAKNVEVNSNCLSGDGTRAPSLTTGTASNHTSNSGKTGTSNSTYPRSSNSSGNSSSNGGFSNSPPNDGSSEGSGNEGQTAATAMPARIETTTFAKALDQPMKVDVGSADRLQHATEMLQAALAHWETCLQSVDTESRAAMLPPNPSITAVAAPRGAITQPEHGIDPEALGNAIRQLAYSLPAEESALKATVLASDPTPASKVPAKQQDTPAARASRKQLPQQQEECPRSSLPAARTQLEQQLEECARNNLKALHHLEGLQGPVQPPRTAAAAAAVAEEAWAAWQQQAVGYPLQPAAFAGNPFLPNVLGERIPAMPWMTPAMPVAPPGLLLEPQQHDSTEPAPLGSASGGKGGGKGNRSKQAGSKAAVTTSCGGETLRTHLKELQQVPTDRVLIARRINRLGFQSADILKAHFSQYGTVCRVLVSHSHVKSYLGSSRLRPSGLGFVVMSTQEEAANILRDGPEQLVKAPGGATRHTPIRVSSFERRFDDEAMEEDVDGPGPEDGSGE